MLAALETVDGVNGTFFSMSAFPILPTHVPLASFTKSDMPGSPFNLYFSSRALNCSFFGCRSLLSCQGIPGAVFCVCSINSFLQDKRDSALRIRMHIFF